jgi:hypothetical protein
MNPLSNSPVRRGGETTNRAEVRRLLHAWPVVLRLSTDPWAKAFAASVWQKAGDDPRWMPSFRQLSTMRAMVREIGAQSDDEVTLIED